MLEKKTPLEIIGFIGPLTNAKDSDSRINLLSGEIETIFTRYIHRGPDGTLFKSVIGYKSGIEVIRVTYQISRQPKSSEK